MSYDEDDHMGQGRSKELLQSQSRTTEFSIVLVLFVIIALGFYGLYLMATSHYYG